MPKVPKKRKVKSGKERTGKGNLGDQQHRRQRIRTQMINGDSQSDVTVQDLEELSRAPKRKKTEVGHCQKVCQGGAKLQGTTAVAFWVSKFVPALKSREWDTTKAVAQKLVRQGEYIRRATSHTGQGRYPSNQDETGSVLRLR